MTKPTKDKHRAEIPDEPVKAGESWTPAFRQKAIEEPGYHFRYVREDQVDRRKLEGYEIATEKKGSGMHGHVLMRCRMATKEARDRYHAQETDFQVRAVQPDEQAEKLGPTGFVPTPDPEDRG